MCHARHLLWNALPREIRNRRSIETLKSNLKHICLIRHMICCSLSFQCVLSYSCSLFITQMFLRDLILFVQLSIEYLISSGFVYITTIISSSSIIITIIIIIIISNITIVIIIIIINIIIIILTNRCSPFVSSCRVRTWRLGCSRDMLGCRYMCLHNQPCLRGTHILLRISPCSLRDSDVHMSWGQRSLPRFCRWDTRPLQ